MQCFVRRSMWNPAQRSFLDCPFTVDRIPADMGNDATIRSACPGSTQPYYLREHARPPAQSHSCGCHQQLCHHWWYLTRCRGRLCTNQWLWFRSRYWRWCPAPTAQSLYMGSMETTTRPRHLRGHCFTRLASQQSPAPAWESLLQRCHYKLQGFLLRWRAGI